MKKIGILLIIIGTLWAAMAFNMSTSVNAGGETYGSGEYSIKVPQMRVNNLGLMEERRNHLMFSGLTILIGVMLLGFGTVSENRNIPAAGKKDKTGTPGTRACPFCAELVKPEAIICRFCRKDLPEPAPDAEAPKKLGPFVLCDECGKESLYSSQDGKLVEDCPLCGAPLDKAALLWG